MTAWLATQVLSPKVFFVRENTYQGMPNFNLLDNMSERDLLESYKNLAPVRVLHTTDGKRRLVERSFASEWVKDENIRQLNNIDMIPPPMECPKGVYNSFKGFPAAQLPTLTSEEAQAPVEPFRRHLVLSFGEESAAFIRLWLAWVLQRPGERTGIMLVILGMQGCGKGWLLVNLMRAMLGHYHGYTEKPAEDLFHKFGQLR